MMIDTGLPFQWKELKQQLLAVLDGRPLNYVFATHPESPHMGNAGQLLELFPDTELIGDLRNYHLYLPKLTHRFSPKKVGDVIDLGGRTIEIIPGIVHDLPNTLWGYELPHRILFVSDGYPYTHQHEAGQCAMTSEELPATPLAEDTGPVIEGALGWTRHVPAELVIRDVEAMLERYPTTLIAPAHGGVVTNPAAMTEVFKAGLQRISGAPIS